MYIHVCVCDPFIPVGTAPSFKVFIFLKRMPLPKVDTVRDIQPEFKGQLHVGLP